MCRIIRYRIFSLLIVLIFYSLSANGTNPLPPSKYIGIFNEYNGIENGKLPNLKKYTGEWQGVLKSYSHIRGQYKNGIPVGTWLLTYPFGGPHIVYYYNNNQYVATSYYPDGIIQTQSYGVLEISKNIFLHKCQNSYLWDPTGNRKKKVSFMKHFGWNWSLKDSTNFEQHREFNGKKNNAKIIAYISGYELKTVFYLYSKKSFIYKKTFVHILDNKKGIMKLAKTDYLGKNTTSKPVINFRLHEISQKKKKLVLNVNFIINSKTVTIDIPFIIELNSKN